MYCNTLDCELVYDDKSAIVNNKDLRPTSAWSNLLVDDFWGTPMSDRSSHKSYRPVTVATFKLNYILHGLEPLGYHLLNVFLHGVSCFLFTIICDDVIPVQKAVKTSGALFALHPIHTEAVSN